MKQIKTIYEDANVLVLNKPSGLIVHADGKTKEETLADKIFKEYPKLKNVGEPMTINGKVVYRPGIVHRLDKDTSGVIVVAKNQKTFLFLKKQFQDRTIKKTYRAIVYGNIKNNSGIIDRPLGRSRNDFRQFSAHKTARGDRRDAITEYKVLERFKDKKEDFSYLEVYPKTGRTHQIRAHLKFINHPVVSDNIYAGKRGGELGLSRLALHAYSIEFLLPSGKLIKLQAPVPIDMRKALK